MAISLKTATIQDCERIHHMQRIGFKPLLDKYRDYDTNPGAESLERVRGRFGSSQVDHYFIQLAHESIGYIRISRLDAKTCGLAQMFILPDYQGKGYAQQAIQLAEQLYPQAERWVLDTIKQEQKLCHLYEKMGYRLTGAEKSIQDGMDLVDYAKQREFL